MMRHHYRWPLTPRLSAFTGSRAFAPWPGKSGSGSLEAVLVLRLLHTIKACGVVSLTSDHEAQTVGTQLRKTPLTVFWLCVGSITAAGAFACLQDSRRHQVQRDTGGAHARSQYTSTALRSTIFSDALNCKEWWLSDVATAVSSTPAVFRGGAPAFCKELSRQHIQREQQHLPQPLKPQHIFEMMKPLVVRVYAVLQTQAPSDRRIGKQTKVDEDQEMLLEKYHFLGSGFFFDDQGHIVTAAHVVLRPNDLKIDAVVSQNAHESRERLVKGEFASFPLAIKDAFGRLHAAHLCGLDESTDVAVLRLEDSLEQRDMPHVRGSELHTAKERPSARHSASSHHFGWSTGSVLIHSAVEESIHNHARDGFQLYEFSVTRPAMGEVIAAYAPIEHADEPIGVAGQVLQPRQTFREMDNSRSMSLLQLQLLTLPGMSGAPVFNMEGSIVGMLVKKFDICGLALPSSVVLRVAESLRDSGEFRVLSIGVLVEEETPRLSSEQTNSPTGSGLKVCGVTPGSPADEAGVRQGDRIINVKGEAIDSIGRVSLSSPYYALFRACTTQNTIVLSNL